MRTDEPRPIRLIDYAPPPFTIDAVRLAVDVDPDRTVVTATSSVRRIGAADAALRLDGEDLELISVRVDGCPLDADAYALTAEALELRDLPDQAEIEITTAFSPRKNTALSGIYLSNDRIFSQCEAEGFRRITYFLDRPDVLARYRVRIRAKDRDAFPILLSNGDPVGAGEDPDGGHWAEWDDPFPKPSYLFALVAGRFDRLDDAFTTRSGKAVDLRIYVDTGDAPRAAYALDALKRSMAWDEDAFGREYDLGLFMIVAVRDFNFGAMENKGLNIFNSALLLADPDSATDADYEAIEAVVAHEYFHNWTGNRITCRDWFQLCLKEGLTVFRDQEFSASQRGGPAQRIKDVRRLRARQFPEDAGPLAHPVRPAQYVKIDNFYTATVYEKGAELVRLLRALIGLDAFAAGLDLYFARHDGQACTIEDFLACFEDAAGRDLAGMHRWYAQAGTPHVGLAATHDPSARTLSITLRQTTRATAASPNPDPPPIPVALGLIGRDGTAIPVRFAGEPAEAAADTRTILLDAAETTARLVDVGSERPAISALRGFSAPVVLQIEEPGDDRALRAAHDRDPFNRWEALQSLATDALLAAVEDRADQGAADATVAAMAALLDDDALDPALAALGLTLPDETDLARSLNPLDPAATRAARHALLRRCAEALEPRLRATYARLTDAARDPAPDAARAGPRALRNACLRILAWLGPAEGGATAEAHYGAARAMTDRIAALAALDDSGAPAYEDALARLRTEFGSDPLVLDKWFAIQARSQRPDALARIERLLADPDYNERTPNRVRAVLGGFGFANLAALHDADGRGPTLMADRILAIDGLNPALAARLAGAFETWRRLEPGRAARARAALERLRAADGLSSNTLEIVAKTLDD